MPSCKAWISPRRTLSGVRKLMGDVGAPAPARFAMLFERAREMIEVTGQRAELVAATVADTATVVAFGQRAGSGGQFANRVKQPASEGKCQQQGHGENRHARRSARCATGRAQRTDRCHREVAAACAGTACRRCWPSTSIGRLAAPPRDVGIADHRHPARIDQQQAREQVEFGMSRAHSRSGPRGGGGRGPCPS